MNFEFIRRLLKEFTITGSAIYEIVLAISERVNRKVQIVRLHWHASMLLQHIDRLTLEIGRYMTDEASRGLHVRTDQDSAVMALDAALARAVTQIKSLKQTLARVDAQIRELKLEAIHEDMLKLQQDLSMRSARIERLTIARHAAAVGRSIHELPHSTSVHIVSVLRGPFLLAPSDSLIFRQDDIVILIGLKSELDLVVLWFTSPWTLNTPIASSA